MAFCIPVIIMLGAVIYKEIYPFGDRSFLRVDLYNQYLPFFTELHRKLTEGGSLGFSFRAGLGANFMAIYAYYLASPMNWLLFFCPKNWLIEFMTALIVLKIGLCGLTFAWYLMRHFKTDSYAVSLFAVFYALSGFLAAYNWNIMWLDCIFLTPLIILGLEELVKNGKCYLYCLSLGASILCNYYISMLICLFLVLYFILLIWQLPLQKKGRAFLPFAIYSLLAAGLAGAVFIPGAMALRATRYDNFNFPKSVTWYFSAIEMIARHCVNVAVEIRNDHWPNIYCGVAVFFLFPLYVINRKISWKEKLPRIACLSFFLLSFSMNRLNFIWHGMNYPNSLPARQSFLYIFLLLVLCFETFLHIKDYSDRQMGACLIGALAFLYLCSRLIEKEDIKPSSFVFTMLYLIGYALLLYWQANHSLKGKWLFTLSFLLIISEVFMNTVETSVATTSRTKYVEEILINRRLTEGLLPEALTALELEPAGKTYDFYRIEEDNRMTKNDGMLTGYPTATLFSSTTNEAVAAYYKSLGLSTSKVFYSHDGMTPLSSALLGVRYVCSDNAALPGDFYNLQKTVTWGEKEKYLYQTRYSLPLGFMVPEDMYKNWDREKETPFDIQNHLVSLLGVKEPLYYSLEVDEKEGSVEIPVLQDAHLYAYVSKSSSKNVTVKAGEEETTFKKVNYRHILDLGLCTAGTISIFPEEEEGKEASLEVEVCEINEDSLREAIKRLEKEPMEILEMKDTKVRGKIRVTTPGLLTLSIPAESGWKAKVDGKAAEIVPFGDAMLGVELSEGEHEVEFTYTVPGGMAGIVVSTLCALTLFFGFYFRQKRCGGKDR